MLEQIKVLLDTSPLINANAFRGVGVYTRFLIQELEKLAGLKVERSTRASAKNFKADIIHYPYFDLFFPTLPIIKKQKTVVTIHDVIPLIFADHYPIGIKGGLALRKQKLALKTVQAVITDSEASKQDICQYLDVPLAKVHVVYLAGNPLIEPQNKTKIKQAKKQYQLPQDYVLYVGDINYNKNLAQLIKAIKFLPEGIHLVLLGKNFKEQDIPEWQWISSQIAMSNIADRIHFVTEIYGSNIDSLSAIYSGALCYIQPSLYEGFGLPVLEAMQARTPVVSTHNSSLIEIGDGHVVYVDAQAQSIAEGIKQIITWSSEQRSEVIQQAEQWAHSFSWSKTAQETYAVYQSLF